MKNLDGEELSTSIPLPILVPSYHFDSGSARGKGKTELQVYTQWKKQGNNDPNQQGV